MFPISADKLSFLKIADYWSRESLASQDELLADLEAAWWRGQITGNSAKTRLQVLRRMYELRHDLQYVVFITPNDPGPQTQTARADGGFDVDLTPRISVPNETDDWSENSCNDAFEELAQLPSQQYFRLFSYSICYIELTLEEFFSWARTKGYDLPGFWKARSFDDVKIRSKQKVNEAPKTFRRVSEADKPKIYKQYREEHGGIPTRDEEEKYMRSRSVGREWVRKERTKYPRRKRGEKITKAKSRDQIGS